MEVKQFGVCRERGQFSENINRKYNWTCHAYVDDKNGEYVKVVHHCNTSSITTSALCKASALEIMINQQVILLPNNISPLLSHLEPKLITHLICMFTHSLTQE